jgi:hypothetical protein
MFHKRILLIIAFLSLVVLQACEKEDTKNVSTTLRVPVLELEGDEFMSVAVGATFTEPGAKYTGEDGATVTLQPASNTVNTAAPGIYEVTYSKKSASGIFESEAKRLVAVAYQENPVDYSGTYLRPATGISATVTRVAPGFYQVQNPGGSPGHGAVTVYFIETALNQFVGPLQHEDIGGVGDIEITDIQFTLTGASWRIINNPYYGTATRTFVKQ